MKTTEEIKSEGFKTSADPQVKATIDFNKIRVGLKTLEDAVLNLNSLKQADQRLADKKTVLTALGQSDLSTLREISNFFMRVSGIYARLVRYMAYLYRYDWLITPYRNDDKIKDEKVLEGFLKSSDYLQQTGVKKLLGNIALAVVRDGCYYGYIIDAGSHAMIQDLPVGYCRSRFNVAGRPAVEFNMKYFDTAFRDVAQRLNVLKLFPKEFSKGYIAYKQGKLPPQFMGDTDGWYLLDTKCAIKFNLNNSDIPFFVDIVPALIDLQEAQELDRKKMAQQLLKIIIQKMPVDKNGDLVFDVDEATELHNNVVRMLGKAIGVDVLTTFADVNVADMADRSSVTSIDQLEKVERTVFNESGTAQNLFNTSGNTALEKSILNDEASIWNLVLQFEEFLNILIAPFNKNRKKLYYAVSILPTTIYNYKDLVKMYKEQTQLGYSKFLPAVAIGQSQTNFLATVHFENDVLDLVHTLVPPLSSNTMNAAALAEETTSDKETGRPEKADDEKSDKTLQNLESMS